MEMILALLILLLIMLVIFIVLKNNKIEKMEYDIQRLKEELIEVRGVIYK